MAITSTPHCRVGHRSDQTIIALARHSHSVAVVLVRGSSHLWAVHHSVVKWDRRPSSRSKQHDDKDDAVAWMDKQVAFVTATKSCSHNNIMMFPDSKKIMLTHASTSCACLAGIYTR